MKLLYANRIPAQNADRSMIAEIFLYGPEKKLALRGLTAAVASWQHDRVDPQGIDHLNAGLRAIEAADRHSFPILVMRSSQFLTHTIGEALLGTKGLGVEKLIITHQGFMDHANQPIETDRIPAETLYVGIYPTHNDTTYPPNAFVYLPETDQVRIPISA